MVLEEFEDTRNTLKRQSGLKNSVLLLDCGITLREQLKD
jgi:hypothetical protein